MASKNNKSVVGYDYDTDYQSLINNAISAGNSNLARQYEAQRNAKIGDMNAQGTNIGGYQQTNYYQPIQLPEYKQFEYKDFKYDVNNDDIYKQYAAKYAREGQSASERALANTAAATGGMTSSYAAAANAQAQQAYAKKTADMIPELEQNAYNRYANERNFSYQDYLNKYNSDVQNAQSLYNSELGLRDFDYQNYLNVQNRGDTLAQRDIDNTFRQSQFDWTKDVDLRDFDYGKGQDAIRNSISWAGQGLSRERFEYDKQQDELARNAAAEGEARKRDLWWYDNAPEEYPNTPYGQEKRIKDMEAKAMETERINEFYSALSEAMTSKDVNVWLNENIVALKQAGIYDDIIKVLSDRKKFQ